MNGTRAPVGLATSRRRVRPGSRVVIDLGDGPRHLLIGTIDDVRPPHPLRIHEDDVLVPMDSSLGRALLGARTGDRIRYVAADGAAMARVLAVEAPI